MLVRTTPALLGALVGCADPTCDWEGNERDEGVDRGLANACVAEGERFDEHFDCADVGGPCPMSDERGAVAQVPSDPARLDDPDFEWVNAQIAACGCSCCHRAGQVSAHKWSIDFQPAWVEGVPTRVIGLLAKGDGGEPDDGSNHGFDQVETHLPSSDGPRMAAYLQREIDRR